MQEGMSRLRRRKRNFRKAIVVFLLCLVTAFILVSIRSCSDQFKEPNNKTYQPMDTQRQPGTNF